jgi:hypothetical protein
MSSIFGILSPILGNWATFCQPEFSIQKCPVVELDDRSFVHLMVVLSGTSTYVGINFWIIGHFLFAYRYFEVAEMFGRKDKSQDMHLKARKITSKIRNGLITLISACFLTLIILIVTTKKHETNNLFTVGSYL